MFGRDFDDELTEAQRIRVAEVDEALRELEALDIHYPPGYLEEIRAGWGRYDDIESR
ncbi:MAG TPA: hypothetical protein VGP37_07670 [Candidatus Nanopelagicales bacterium]|nr:hypothetical protein [Candidatus Nanopelagicales bacterium]